MVRKQSGGQSIFTAERGEGMFPTIGLLLTTLFLLWFIKATYNLIRAIILRLVFLAKLNSLCKKRGYKALKTRLWFASFFAYSNKPDRVVICDGKNINIRFITCRARKRFYYFVNSNYYIRCAKIIVALPAARVASESTPFIKFRYIPPLDKKYTVGDVKNILLFSPAPVEITARNSSGTGKVAIGNGSELDGCLAFNGNGFIDSLMAR